MTMEERICEKDKFYSKSGVKDRWSDGESKGGDCEAICAERGEP